MTNLKFGEKELQIKYGYKITWKSGIIKKLVALSNEDEDRFKRINNIMEILPELLLLGVQKYHSDEYGYNYENNEGKDAQLDKVCDLLDDYFDSDDADFEELLGSLQSELLENGFLASMFRQEAEKKTKKK